MTFTTLIPADDLRTLLAGPTPPLLLDCSFELTDPGAGERAYAGGHLPGALYAHLDRDLSAPKTCRNGRHPLPSREVFAATVGRWGVAPGVQVVTYDAQGGAFAARAWWMLRWLGHRAVAVLDGGLQAWTAAGGTLQTQTPPPSAQPPYPAGAAAMPTIDVDTLARSSSAWTIVDARPAERYRGEVEPMDPVAGRIPGALNRAHRTNLDADGRFRPAADLRREFLALAADPSRVVHQCGSGVNACHNLLAMTHAGLAGSTLFPGSWSEWCADPSRPVARG